MNRPAVDRSIDGLGIPKLPRAISVQFLMHSLNGVAYLRQNDEALGKRGEPGPFVLYVRE